MITTNLHLMSLSNCQFRTNDDVTEGRNCGHICWGMWPLFLPIRFLWKWTIENTNNALWWHCWDRSGNRELLQCSRFCVTLKQRWHWCRTLQRTQCATITTNVIRNVRHSDFSLGECIRCQTWRRDKKNFGLKGLANFEIAKPTIFLNIKLYHA